MSRRSEPAVTWYDLIHTFLEEDAARTVLNAAQVQSLMARLKKEKVFANS